MTAPRKYITTAIPYVNGPPHLGFAFEILLADSLARFHRQLGGDVRFLTGTDENSLKNVLAAEREGISTSALVARNAARFRSLRETLCLSWDDFIRTSADPRHRPGVEALWRACERRGDIDRRSYSGLYCVGCEQFYTDAELDAGLCPEHRVAPERIEEENYFFRLSDYGDRLLDLLGSGRLRIEPPQYRNEIVRFIRSGLQDISISRRSERARGWGIPVPGDPDQVVYVWFDALVNYLTALGYGGDDELLRHFWCDESERTHVIGKGITRFHAVYWPAILLSAGLPLPDTIFVHGYVTVEGSKIGKSAGPSHDPAELVEEFGVDSLRYYLLRHLRAGQDGDFNRRDLLRAHNDELADQLGNLLSRTRGLLARYAGSIVPSPGEASEPEKVLIAVAESLPGHLEHSVADLRLHDALAGVWTLVTAANRYVERAAPWQIAKERSPAATTRLATVLYSTVEALRLIALQLAPFLPNTSLRISESLGLDLDAGGSWHARSSWGGLTPGGRLPETARLLFEKHPVEDTARGTP